MIQIYADGVLAYDSRLEEYDLQGLRVTTGLNKGGTAEIVMPPGHPAYGSYVSYKTIVEVYRDGLLKFRGRALPPSDTFYKVRTLTCEGELCFFQDAVSRPYLYQADPATVFASVVAEYNAQVEPIKQFKVGTVTVVDANGYIRVESEDAETSLATLQKLLERCGGYFVFTTDVTDGKRVINWLAQLEYRSSQTIEFGENLLDFSRGSTNTAVATAILPYGAKDEMTGQRVTVASVNNGLDYIVDEDARALRGFIIQPVIWDDVTQPVYLLRKAQAYLASSRYIITSLSLSALDLSYVDKSIDGYQVGDLIRVYSKPHGVDEDFLLTERTEDFLNPANSQITLGKDLSSLTGADVAGDNKNFNELHKVKHQIKSEYTLNTAQVVQATALELTSLIEQTSTNIRLEMSETFLTNDQVDEKISTSMEQTVEGFEFSFDELKKTVDENDAEAREQFSKIHKYIHFIDGGIQLGNSESAITLTIESDRISFKKNDAEFGWWDGENFHTGNIVIKVNERAQFGAFAFVPRTNGSLSFLKVQ